MGWWGWFESLEKAEVLSDIWDLANNFILQPANNTEMLLNMKNVN